MAVKKGSKIKELQDRIKFLEKENVELRTENVNIRVEYEQEKARRKEVELQLKHALEEAGLDSLTRLLNHGSFRETAEHVFELCSRGNKPVAILYVDLDDFKRINDIYGHSAGDEVLKEVTALLNGQFRESDILGRTGGDEFVALLPETDEKHAETVVKKIEQAFKVHTFRVGAEKLPISASIGVVEVSPEINTLEELIHEADMKMYEIKRRRKYFA